MSQTGRSALDLEADAQKSHAIDEFAVSSPPKDLRTLKASGDAIDHALYQEQVRKRAYELWESAGRPPGDGREFWAAAESEIAAGHPLDAN